MAMSNNTVLTLFDADRETTCSTEYDATTDELYALTDDPMQNPIKLVSDSLQFTDLHALQPLFVENTGFLVIGTVGLQGVGKSSILNALANHCDVQSTLFNTPFDVHSCNEIMDNVPRSGGIDLYITQDRVILLDVQPFPSYAHLNRHADSCDQTLDRSDVMHLLTPPCHLPKTAVSGLLSGSSWTEITSVQIISFLLNVCHIVLVVTDSIGDSSIRLHRLIDRAASLKPTVYTNSVLSDRFRDRSDGRRTGTAPSACEPSLQFHESNAVKLGPDSRTDHAEASVDFAGVHCSPAQDVASPYSEQTSNGNGDLISSRLPGVDMDRESSDVVDAYTRLKALTDYSASLIHIYNRAPADVFLDTVLYGKVDAYHRHGLYTLYSNYRRTSAFFELGPRILRAYPTAKFQNESATSSAMEQSDARAAASLHFPRNSAFPDSKSQCVPDTPPVNPQQGGCRADSGFASYSDSVLTECQSTQSFSNKHLPGTVPIFPRFPMPIKTLFADDDYTASNLTPELNQNRNRKDTKLPGTMHPVPAVRERFFNGEWRLTNPRFVIVPDLDEKGNSATGCPSYGSVLLSLRETVFSTPRQHMISRLTEKKWIAYAKEMWEAVRASRIIIDYDTVLAE